MIKLVLGNRSAVRVTAVEGSDGVPVRSVAPYAEANRYTYVEIPDELNPAGVVHALIDADGVWANHAEPGTGPAWVSCEDEDIANLVSTLYGGIEVRSYIDPETAVGEDGTVLDAHPDADEAPGVGNGSVLRAATVGLLTMLNGFLFMRILFMVALVARMSPQLKTLAGSDFQAKQMAGAASATAVAKWMALTADTTTPTTAMTSLTGEITTGGGGLIRQAAVYAHTGGTTTYTLTGTYTANGSDSLPVTIGRMGVFDASSSGNMPFTTLISPTAVISASGDVLTVTQTVTM